MPIKFTGKGGGVGIRIEVLNGSLAVGRREGVFDDFSCGVGERGFGWFSWNGRGIINVQFKSFRRAIQTWSTNPPPSLHSYTHTHTHNHLNILACSKFLISQAITLVLSPGS